MRADAAKHKKAKIDMLMAVDEASVNILSAPSRILFVIGIAEDADDIKKYAIICNTKKTLQHSNTATKQTFNHLITI